MASTSGHLGLVMHTHPTAAPGDRADQNATSFITSIAFIRALAVVSFTLLTALGANIAIPLPPYGIPMTLQTLAVLMAALCLGPKLGSISMLLYLAVGAIGAPVFAANAGTGMGVLLGQTGGFLLGFVLCQPVIGLIVRRRDGSIRGWGAMILAIVAADLIIYGLGVPWLAVIRDLSFAQALEGGFYPFLPGMVLKSAIAIMLGKLAAPIASRRIW